MPVRAATRVVPSLVFRRLRITSVGNQRFAVTRLNLAKETRESYRGALAMNANAVDSGQYFIGIPVYDGVDLLDVAAPYELFSWMAEFEMEKRGRQIVVCLVAHEKLTVKTRDRLEIKAHRTFAQCPQLNVMWVPGGEPERLKELMKDQAFLDFLRAQSTHAEYVTSVCEGALLLASAGLLDGFEATTHWAFLPCLKQFPKIRVVDGYPRYHKDRNRITGGGISSGIDEALALISLVSGDEVAKDVQLTIQYHPKPPFCHGDPEQAGIEPAKDCPIQLN